MYRIALIPGDGIGREVAGEAAKVVKRTGVISGTGYEFIEYDLGGERYLRTGEVLPDGVLDEIGQMDAIFLGAVGHPDVKPGILEKDLLLKIRFHFDQYINLRPVKLYPGVPTPLRDKGPEDIDFVVVRENTEGLYAGSGGLLKRGTEDEVAIQEMVYTRKGTERCIRYAYDLAKKRRKRLTLVDKSNVLTYGHDLWQRVFREVGKEYPEVEEDHAYVDAACMWMVKNPEHFDVIVTCNMFGDIITDLGAAIQGGMGVAAGANINPQGISMFEPIHGSAPKYKGLGKANPLAAILAAQMMVDWLGEEEDAERIERAVVRAIGSGKIKGFGAGKMGLSTQEVGDLVVSFLEG
jgi:3-isopropylmalate dehydrogenase